MQKEQQVKGATPFGGFSAPFVSPQELNNTILKRNIMPTDHNKMNKVRRAIRDEIAILEEKCKNGPATKKDFEELTKLRRKMK